MLGQLHITRRAARAAARARRRRRRRHPVRLRLLLLRLRRRQRQRRRRQVAAGGGGERPAGALLLLLLLALRRRRLLLLGNLPEDDCVEVGAAHEVLLVGQVRARCEHGQVALEVPGVLLLIQVLKLREDQVVAV